MIMASRNLKTRAVNKILSGKNLLVTGGAGFVGSHLAERLLAEGAKVFVLDWKLHQPGYFASQKLDAQTACIDVDLKNLAAVQKAVAENAIDYIYHIGAQALVSEAFLNPFETFGSNIMGTVNVLEAARACLGRVKGVFVASSDKAYGKDCLNALESQKVFGDHPYDASKAAADMLARSYFTTYALPVVVARFGNIFGPGDVNFSRIVPGAMQAIIKNQVLEIRSDGEFRRDYLFVKDVAQGYIQMAEKLDGIKGEAFNFSSGLNFSVIEIVEKIGQILGRPVKYKILNTQKNEIPKQSLNFDKAKAFLGWQAGGDFGSQIQETFEWYKNYFKA